MFLKNMMYHLNVKTFNKIILLISLVSLVAFILSGCFSLLPQEDEMLPIPMPSYTVRDYRTIQAERKTLEKKFTSFGVVGFDYTNIEKQNFKVNGYIDEIFVEEGEIVEEGQLLATLKEPKNKNEVEYTYNETLNRFLDAQDRYLNQQATKYEFRYAEIQYEHAKEAYDLLDDYMKSLNLYASKSGYVINVLALKEDTPIGYTIDLCSIADDIDLKIEASLTTATLKLINLRSKVILIFDDTEYDGYVAKIEGTTLEIKSDQMPFLKTGDIVQLYIVLEKLVDVLVIPKNVVAMTSTDSGSVRILKDKVPVTLNLKFGLVTDTEIEVLPGQGIDEETLIIGGSY